MKSRSGNDGASRAHLALARRRIAVIGNYGNRNLGDEATLASLLQFLKRQYPQAAVCALSERPEETRRRHGIEAAPSIPRKSADRPASPSEGVAGRPAVPKIEKRPSALKATLKRVRPLYLVLRTLAQGASAASTLARGLRFAVRGFTLLRGKELLIIAGGGQLSDHFSGVRGFPVQLFTWCLLARGAGAKVIVLNVGAGPIRGRASRLLFRWTLRLVAYRSYRDERSRRLIGEIGVPDPGPVAPDLVFSWVPSGEPAERPGGTAAGRTVGLNVFPFRDGRYWSMPDETAYRAYLQTISRFILWLLDEGYRVRLYPTQLKADARVIADVRQRLDEMVPAGAAERLEVPRIETVDELAAVARDADVIVATRFHAIVMAMLAGKPILALCNESKMADLMADMGQARHCLSLEGLELDVLKSGFVALESVADQAAGEVRERVAQARARLDRQLEAVFGELLGRSISRASVEHDGGAERLGLSR